MQAENHTHTCWLGEHTRQGPGWCQKASLCLVLLQVCSQNCHKRYDKLLSSPQCCSKQWRTGGRKNKNRINYSGCCSHELFTWWRWFHVKFGTDLGSNPGINFSEMGSRHCFFTLGVWTNSCQQFFNTFLVLLFPPWIMSRERIWMLLLLSRASTLWVMNGVGKRVKPAVAALVLFQHHETFKSLSEWQIVTAQPWKARNEPKGNPVCVVLNVRGACMKRNGLLFYTHTSSSNQKGWEWLLFTEF